MDERELGLYLGIIFQKERRREFRERQPDEVIPVRKHEAAKTVLMSTEEVLERSGKTVSKFCETSQRKPNRAEVRRMIGLALEEAIKTAMQNHVYTFNGIVRRQREGGTIGNKLTGGMAKVFMSRWTREFRAKVTNAAKNIDNFARTSERVVRSCRCSWPHW